jgi:hypothetical protein
MVTVEPLAVADCGVACLGRRGGLRGLWVRGATTEREQDQSISSPE